ncbi:MAG: phage terminase large subunit [Alphaproteobacteria bacterium]|nr:phage terminase large subunit [Alphaproteobacteria bacterium]
MSYNSALNFLNAWNELIGFETPEHHKTILRFLVESIDSVPRRALLAAFRHSGKSTVVGIFAAWVLSENPAARILILSAETNLASRMVSHIKHILENHALCQDMLPTVKREWGTHRLTINRPPGIREPSVICQGISGNITGMRSDLIICDDVEVPNTCNTAKKRVCLRERLRELDFILAPNGTMIYIGTPHAKDTIYRT